MTTAICTLFEKDYHHGVAALVNSLVRSGFAGNVYAGYRGPLPEWAGPARVVTVGEWKGARVLEVTKDCALAFLPISTDAHFTNIKPDFMLQLLAEDGPKIERLLYLDPDICVVEKWSFMEDWLTCGVALCEDVNSPLGEHHPRRVGWRRYFGAHGISLEFRGCEYVNGGCVGVSRKDRGFLEGWQLLSRRMAEVIGGLATAKIEGGERFRKSGFASCFDSSDQDALNAALEMNGDLSYSILPRPAMGFAPGAAVLPHALGARKPWRRRYLREAFGAMPPTTADKAFWAHADGPLRSMDASRIGRTRRSLALASALGRVYRRSA